MTNNPPTQDGWSGFTPERAPDPPTLKQREVAALERIAATLEELLDHYKWVSLRGATVDGGTA